MQGNNGLVLKNTQPTVKDGANEELLKRMRALEEVVNFEREKVRKEQEKKQQETLEAEALESRKRYQQAIATLCEKYSGLDKDVVARLSNADKERLADSIEKEVRKTRRLWKLFERLLLTTLASVIGLLSYYAHPGLLFLYAPWSMSALMLSLEESPAKTFLNYREQTKKEDRVALEEAEPDGT